MKKVDAEKLIDKCIEEFADAATDCLIAGKKVEYKGCKTGGEYVLKRLIEAGMLPPSTYLDKLKRYDNAWEE